MIKTLVFDIGNVLVNWYPYEYVKTIVSDKEQAKRLSDIVFESTEWKNGDIGKWSREDTKNALITKYPAEAAIINKILDGCDDILTAVNTEVLKELKDAGFELYYISNTNPTAFEYMKKNHVFFSYLTDGIASFKVNMLKPSKEIFELFLRNFNKNPSGCIFVDDMHINTASARDCGFNTITLKFPCELKKELLKFDDVRVAFEKVGEKK